MLVGIFAINQCYLRNTVSRKLFTWQIQGFVTYQWFIKSGLFEFLNRIQTLVGMKHRSTPRNPETTRNGPSATSPPYACSVQKTETLESVVVHYKAQGTAPALFYYIHVNLQTKTVAEPISLKAPLEDISKDCKLGIDAKLDIYDLGNGQVTKRVPYVNKGIKMRLHVRFTDDSKHVVFIDRVDDTLHVVQYEPRYFPNNSLLFYSCP